jgi:hypothetical protein
MVHMAVRRAVGCVQDSSAAWVANSPGESLAFILHDRGYDMWLANVRGSTWGLRHAHLSPRDAKFWQFSWDDMALSDLPATCASPAVCCAIRCGGRGRQQHEYMMRDVVSEAWHARHTKIAQVAR